jgi:hypothetical protein
MEILIAHQHVQPAAGNGNGDIEVAFLTSPLTPLLEERGTKNDRERRYVNRS